MDAELIQKYKQAVQQGIANNLRNIYLYNVKAFVTKTKVINAACMMLEPDERFMRMIEAYIDIKETEVDRWRKTIWFAWLDGHNTGLIDTRLGPIFMQLAIEYQAINKALLIYPNIIKLDNK